MPAVADAVASALQEASRGGMVKCPSCETLNGKSSVKCKNCGKDLKQVSAKAREDGRSHVSEAITDAVDSVLEGDDKGGKGKGGKGSGRTRRGKFADLPTLATGKRAAPKADGDTPATSGSASGAGPTSVAEADAWGGKPGTNWKQVSPDAKHKLKGILNHYKGMAHPFTTCVRDNTKRFGEERAKRICAVVKDLNEKSTGWRKGGKAQEADADLDAFVERLLEAAADTDGSVDVDAVQEAVVGQLPPLERAILGSIVATGEVLRT